MQDTYRLVHQTESDLGVALVLGSNLGPEAGKLNIGRTALTNDGAIPAGIVVDVDDAHGCTGIQATLNLFVIGGPVVRIERAADTVHKVLPADGNSESVEAIVVNEVLHLVEAGLAGVDNAASVASAISSAAKVETGDLLQIESVICLVKVLKLISCIR